MNYVLVFVLSVLDSIAILPFNSELSFLYTVKQKKYTLKRYFAIASLSYILPAMIGTTIAYYLGYYFGNLVMPYIDFLLTSIFMISLKITPSNLLTTLVFKIFLPILPISLINMLCGIYHANFLYFLLISLLLRTIRVLLIYNAVLISSLYQYIALALYTGLFSLCARILLVIFYRILFIQ